MSRFVRASKYRHVFGQPAKKEHGFENIKVTNSAWDTNIVSASARYLSINWNSSGGGSFAIFPLPSPFQTISGFPHKIPDTIPLARSHTAAVLDTDWSPHNDTIVASGAEDGKIMIWKVDESSSFDGWGQDGWIPQDFDPVLRIDASPRKIGQVLFHPTAANVVASASGEYAIKLWDLANPEDPRLTFTGHGDIIQSMAFNPTGNLLATTCRDKKIRIFDYRAGAEPVRVGDGHSGVKGSRVVWMGDFDRLATTGFSKMSERQVGIWEAGTLGSLKTLSIDQSAGVIMPFWSDNNILFLAGKGDGNIRYYEYESDSLHALAEYKSSEPQRGMCFLPRRALNVSDCEIARAYKVHAASIEPIAFIVPRKADSFQSDIYPPVPASEPSVTAAEFFNGKMIPPLNFVSMADGSSVAAASSPGNTTAAVATFSSSPSPGAAPVPVVAPAIQPTRSYSAAAPAPAPVVTPSPMSYSLSDPVPTPTSISSSGRGSEQQQQQPLSDTLNSRKTELEAENARLEGDLRESREKIRNLELQVETLRANARKAGQALLNAAKGGLV